MVHNDGPQCADTTALAAREVTAGQRFLIGDASLGWNPSSPAIRQAIEVTDILLKIDGPDRVLFMLHAITCVAPATLIPNDFSVVPASPCNMGAT
jgi:hypothetical protein